MKSLVAAAVTVAVAASPALADKKNFGEGYSCLHDRRAARPHGDKEPTVEIKALGESVLAGVVRNKLADIETCWLKVPAAKRVASSAIVHLAVEGGQATDVRVDGQLPAGVAACITAAANRWAFPVVDNRSEVDHAIQFNAR